MKNLLFANFFADNWKWMVAFVAVALVTFLLLFILSKARDASAKDLDYLYHTNIDTYLERLENNKRLNLVFRKSIILLYKLDGYMAKDDKEQIENTIKQLDKISLEPNDRVEYYQKRVSYFVSVGQNEEVLRTRDMLKNYLIKVKALDTPKYKSILEEAEAIVRIYVNKDVTFIDALIAKAQRTQHPVMRGITQYRIAKLAYYKGDNEMVDKYLAKAKLNVKGTYYQPIVDSAILNKKVLEEK